MPEKGCTFWRGCAQVGSTTEILQGLPPQKISCNFCGPPRPPVFGDGESVSFFGFWEGSPTKIDRKSWYQLILAFPSFFDFGVVVAQDLHFWGKVGEDR